MPKPTVKMMLASVPKYESTEEARRASVNMAPGTKMRIGIKGTLAQVATPGRKRGKGAPKAIRFLEDF